MFRTAKSTTTLCLLLPALLCLLPTITNASKSRSFPPWLGCDDDFARGVTHDDECYAVDAWICRWQFQSGCQQNTASYYYYNYYAEGYDYLRYHSVSVVASSNCNKTADEPVQSCTIKVDRKECNACTNLEDDFRVVTLRECSNLPGIFPSEPQSFTVQAGEGYLKMAYNETWCDHPALGTSIPTMDASNSLAPSQTPDPSYTASPTEESTLSPTSLRGTNKPTPPRPRIVGGRVTRPPSIPKKDNRNGIGNNTPQKIAAAKTIVVHPKLKLLSFPFLTTMPSDFTMQSLIQDTHEFFLGLLQSKFPSLTDFEMKQVATGLEAEEGPSNNGLYLNFTVALTLEESSVTTRDVATFLSYKPNLNQFLYQAVKPTLQQVHLVRAWIVSSGAEEQKQ